MSPFRTFCASIENYDKVLIALSLLRLRKILTSDERALEEQNPARKLENNLFAGSFWMVEQESD